MRRPQKSGRKLLHGKSDGLTAGGVPASRAGANRAGLAEGEGDAMQREIQGVPGEVPGEIQDVPGKVQDVQRTVQRAQGRIQVIGVGPGGEDYLLPVAARAVAEAEVLVGGKRALSLFDCPEKEKVEITADLEKAITFLRERKGKRKIAVLVSGDPGLYSFLDHLLRHIPAQELEVIPGLSAVQVAFARAKMSWHDAAIFSLHGRDGERLLPAAVLPAVRGRAKVALFTDARFPPQKIARYLLENGVSRKKMVVAEDLSYPTERLLENDLAGVAGMEEDFANCVVLITDD
ncbi:MAG: precorrin-6y C5,15-methyltransferase (decarboxylating) subunit CbiE [Syntrophothermus sp.]